MTHSMTVRLDDDTAQKLADLAADQPSRSAAIKAAIEEAWRVHQEHKLDAAYAAVAAENPDYPYESNKERAALRARRNAREARA